YHTRHNNLFLQADASRLPFRPAAFDVVVSFETLEHFKNHEGFVHMIRQVLAPGGLLLISTPNANVYNRTVGTNNPFHMRERTLQEFRDLLSANFKNVMVIGQLIATGSLTATIGEDDTLLAKQAIRLDVTSSEPHDLSYPLEEPSQIEPIYLLAVCSDDP